MTSINLTEIFLPYLLLFSRLSAIFLIAPGYGDHHLPMRFRLLFALSLSFVIGQFIDIHPPKDNGLSLIFMILQEILIGFTIGVVGRIALSLFDIIGTMIGFQVGLGNAMMFNPSFSGQMALPSTFLLLCATMFFFTLDLHHIVIYTCIKSYQTFPAAPGFYALKSISELTDYLMQLLGKCLTLGLQISLPFIILGTVFQFFLGLLNRLVPSLQVFFIMLPAQLIFGIILIMITISYVMSTGMGHFKDLLTSFPGLRG